MSTYSITTLLRLWKQNELTAEQAVGYSIQHLMTLIERVTALEKRLNQLESTRHDSSKPTQA